MASGLGFAEFDDESLALFAIRYLNNMEIGGSRALIVDYSLEDVRALHKRDKRIERQRKANDDRKKEQRREAKKEGSSGTQ